MKHKTQTGFFYTTDASGAVLAKYAVSQGDEIGFEGFAAFDVESITELDAIKIPMPYYQARAAEYPNIGDQLDAILKGFNQLRFDGVSLPADLDAIISEWLSIKNKYPKPEV